jgi:hypothetical protein
MNLSPSDFVSDNLNEDILDESSEIDLEVMLAQVLADPNLVQHVMRTRNDGVETMTAYFRCDFSPGQQRYVLHVPFSPAFLEVPIVNSMFTEGSDGRIRVTDCQKFGARLEVILPPSGGSESSLLVEVIATAPV